MEFNAIALDPKNHLKPPKFSMDTGYHPYAHPDPTLENSR